MLAKFPSALVSAFLAVGVEVWVAFTVLALLLGVGYGFRRRLHRHERRLREAQASLAARERLFSHLSHEIRLPLSVLLSSLEMLSNPQVTEEEKQKCIEAMVHNGKYLRDLVNDLLDFSKIRAGKMHVERLAINVVETLEDVKAMGERKASGKNVSVGLELDPRLPPRIVTDPVKIRQILLNLLDNAIKFTPAGHISITAEVQMTAAEGAHRGDPDGNGRLLISVRDPGIGIAPDRVSALFEAFAQADSSITRRFGGTGLGLSISKGLAELMGGTLRVSSELGRGSRFTLVLPLATDDPSGPPFTSPRAPASRPAGRSDPAPRGTARLDGVRVLYADDCDELRAFLEAVLREAGARATFVDSGRAAIEAARRSAFDVIVLDIHMPDMDGVAALRTLRERGIQTPVLAITAADAADPLWADGGGRAESSARGPKRSETHPYGDAGFDGFIAKPFTFPELIQALADAVAADSSL